MKTFLGSLCLTHHEIIFNSKLIEVLGATKKKYPAETRLSEKPTKITKIDKVQIKHFCIDGPIVNGKRKRVLLSFSLSAPPGLKLFKESTTFLFKKVKKNNADKTFYLENDDNNNVDFNDETLTFAVI